MPISPKSSFYSLLESGNLPLFYSLYDPLPRSEQEQLIFDYTLLSLRTQGEFSTDSKGCCYRTGSGLKCAVGFLISDSEYSPDMENNGVGVLVEHFSKQFPSDSHPFKLHAKLLRDLQFVHDISSESHAFEEPWDLEKAWKSWEAIMCKLANALKLIYTPPPSPDPQV